MVERPQVSTESLQPAFEQLARSLAKAWSSGGVVALPSAARLYPSPAQVPAAMFIGYKVECEVAFRFTQSVPAREHPYKRAELEPKLVFHPGLELAGHRYATSFGSRNVTTHDLIADNGACGAYVVADGFEDWRHIDFAALQIDARIDGGEPIQTFSGDYFRDPVDVLVETVTSDRTGTARD